MKYIAKIPGSVMLFGEHAVLHGSWSLVCAVNKYITITLMPRQDRVITINSTSLGKLHTSVDDLRVVAPFEFVLTAILKWQQELVSGFDMDIVADFSHQVGLGSSAAVTVATLSVLHQWFNKKESQPDELLRLGREVILQVQGIGSGADVAASVYRGVVAYRSDSTAVKQLTQVPPITLVYSGYKEPTKAVVALVEARRKQYPKIFAELYRGIEQCVLAAITAIEKSDWQRLGEIMNMHQGLQESLGVCNQQLAELLFTLRNSFEICGAKISGSGLGDCIVGIGKLTGDSHFSHLPGVQLLDVDIA